MKKIILVLGFVLLLFVVCDLTFLQAQQLDNGPFVNPDLMTYFQDEITSLKTLEKRLDGYNSFIVPFFLSFNYYTRLHDNSNLGITNALIGAQIKINDNFYIPLFGATSIYGRSGDTSDKINMTLNDFSIELNYISLNNQSLFTGSGLGINSEKFRLGIFAGYYLEKYDNDYWGYDQGVFRIINETNINHTYKIALVSGLDTTYWKHIGKILNNLFGYIGLGNDIQVYAGDKEKSSYDKIANLLNYAFKLGIQKFYLKNFLLEPTFFSSRDYYDGTAKKDDFGLLLTCISSKYKIELAGGYRNFYSVPDFFASQYPTHSWFVNFSLHRHLGFGSIGFQYQGDIVSPFNFTIVFDLARILTVVYPIKFGQLASLPAGRYRHTWSVLGSYDSEW